MTSEKMPLLFFLLLPQQITIFMQWKRLNMISLGQRKSDNINWMVAISNCLLIRSACLVVIWDLLNLGQFDHINWMITLSMITLSGSHRISKRLTFHLATRPGFNGVINCCFWLFYYLLVSSMLPSYLTVEGLKVTADFYRTRLLSPFRPFLI